MQFENTAAAGTANNGLAGMAVDAISGAVATLLKNGFVNPLAFNPVNNQIKDPQGKDLDALINFPAVNGGYNANPTSIMILKANTNMGYMYETGERIKFNRSITVMIDSKEYKDSFSKNKKNNIKTRYKCKIIDPALISEDFWNKTVYCSHEDLYPLPNSIYLNTVLLPAIATVAAGGAGGIGIARDIVNQFSQAVPVAGNGIATAVNIFAELLESDENKFLNADNNPFTRAFESTMGRGIAGKLGAITFDWLDPTFQWETDYNSRAPMGCKISFNLDVIHDLPPGLDYAGYNRAPLYNVGRVMKDISGDVYNDGGFNSESYFNKSRTVKKG